MNSYAPKSGRSGWSLWLEENLQLVSIAGLVLFFLAAFGLSTLFREEQSPPPVVTMADLDVVMGPVKTWEEGSTTRLKGVHLKIKNRGDVTANGVIVMGTFRGVPLQIPGKTQLTPGEIGDYSITFPVVVLSNDSMEFTAECANCVPFGTPHR